MKIGLIAMSGIRVCDEELLRLGMTLPGFVARVETIRSLPSLGLLTLAAMTPSRHEVAYREVAELDPPGTELEGFDLVALSTFTAQVDEAYALADRYRAAGTPVVMGGLHVTALPHEALEHCDSVVVGEGEPVWPTILADAERGALRPVYGRAGQEADLSAVPIPAFHLLDPERYNRLTVQTSRGCPHRCEFCASSILLTDRYKQKPMERVLAEIDRILEIWDRPFLELADDNTFIHRKYWKRLLPELEKRKTVWFTETDISVGEDEELLELMRRAGCVELLIGLEAPDEAGLRELELRRDWKRRRLPTYRRAVRTIQDHGIAVNGCFILGLDSHGPEIFDRVLSSTEELELFDVQITLLTPFPGTPLYHRLRREGRLIEERPWRRCTLFDVAYRPARMSAAELRDGFRNLAIRLYGDEPTRRRRRRFKEEYLQKTTRPTGVRA